MENDTFIGAILAWVKSGGSLPLASATPSWRATTRHLVASSATPSPRSSAPKTRECRESAVDNKYKRIDK